jgi:hypothetical protein
MAGTERHNRNLPPQEEGGMRTREGLTNGSDSSSTALEVEVGLINGLPNSVPRKRGRGLPLLHRIKRKRRASREALERKATEPLPGADGE